MCLLLLLYIVMLVSVSSFCPSSVYVVATFPYRKACRSRDIKLAAPPLDSTCDEPVTYPGDIETLTLRRLMSYIYGAPILDVSRSHTTTQHSR